ncbi:ABC transporter family substrate-binding protein [Specibacter sp. RAF43]|uniref:ABC transporter family substrate-binding protein n=1 Tax=Specibacter sp. RAF43 TaxID=3233057 RepID=UPI003F980E7E
MRAGRISKTIGSVLALAAMLALGACTSTPSPPDGTVAPTSAAPGGNATVLEPRPFSSFNANGVSGATSINARIDYATHSGFNYVDSTLKIVKNEKFGKYEKISDDPLTVKYTINDGVQWSDGEPVTTADLLLQWAAASGYFNDATLGRQFKVIKGTAYFHYAGDTSGLSHTAMPSISDDGKSLTLTYSKNFPDWETALGSQVSIPAHIVAVRAGLKDAATLSALLQGLPKGDPDHPKPPNPTLRKIADFWNTGFDTKSMPDPSLALSNGPYLVQSITPGEVLVLTRNPDYTWGTAPHLETITVKYVPGAGAQLAALKDKTADIISPPATAETVTALQELKPAGVQIQLGQGLGFDQVVLNFQGVLAKQDLRKAFLATIPRTDILDTALKPLMDTAVPLNSFAFLPGQTPYKESTGNNGSAAFAAPDPDAARTLLNGATPTVRILYNKDDPIRVQEYNLIVASATLAGFRISDAGKSAADWQAALHQGAFDVALFGWTSMPTGSAQVPQIFKTGAPSNLNNFSNAVVDQLVDQLSGTADSAKQNALKMQIDKLVWEAGYGLPLFQRVGLVAAGPDVSGVRYSPVGVGPWWNLWDWQRTK